MGEMETLREDCLRCRECPLCEKRHNVVFGVGNESAELMFIGEGPGEQEDLRGEPFYERRKSQRKKCVIIGNEGAGISPAVLEKATMRLKIPIVGGAESLNAAVAGAIMMYDLLREEITEK